MVEILMIIGYPGSGKSYKANSICESEPGKWIIVDDPKDSSVIEKLVKENKNLIICDPHLCNSMTRRKARFQIRKWNSNVHITELFFENDIEKCWKNVQYRNDGRLITKNTLKSFKYNIPKNITPIPIWQNT